MENKIKVADFILSYLLDKGIDQCFCVTGGGAMHLNDSFGHSPELNVIYNHHEQAAAMAAEAYARLINKPAIVSVTSGPGVTNAITGVYGAWADSIPMIVISGQMKHETTLNSTHLPLRYLGFQEADTISLVKPFTKYAAYVNDVDSLLYHLENAYIEATTGRKGPTWLDIPLDFQAKMISKDEIDKRISKVIKNTDEQDMPLSQDLANLIYSEINASRSPVIMLGEEVRLSDASNDVRILIERLKIPVVTEWNAHDLIEDDHPMCAGRPGTIGNRGGNFVVQNSDLLIAIGCQLSIRQISYEWNNFARKAKKIGISIDKYELSKKTVKFDIAININVKNFIKSMIDYSYLYDEKSDDWLKWSRSILKKYPVVRKGYYDKNIPLNAYPFIHKLSMESSENHVTVLANGAACVCGLQAYNIKKNARIFTNAGASSMGYGISAAIGTAVTGRPTICIEGDGSIMMNLAELQTIATNQLNVKVFIINNSGYHSIKQTQKNIFKADIRGYCGADKASGIGFPNFELIAKSFELEFFKIDSLEKLNNIKDILNYPYPLLCEVIVDPNQDFEPKLVSKLLEDGGFETPSLEDMYPFLSAEEMESNRYIWVED